MSSKYTWLLDPGHGGIVEGVYQTKGKRSPEWPDGRILFEGDFNRKVVSVLKELLSQADIDFVDVVDSNEDIPLRRRVERANQVKGNTIYLSIHCNAGGGTGWEVYTSKGQTKSDAIATVFFNTFKNHFSQFKFRSDHVDGDPDKESQFYVLKNTNMPAILTENFFMDRLEPDCSLLLSEEGHIKIAIAHFDAILKIEENNS